MGKSGGATGGGSRGQSGTKPASPTPTTPDAVEADAVEAEAPEADQAPELQVQQPHQIHDNGIDPLPADALHAAELPAIIDAQAGTSDPDVIDAGDAVEAEAHSLRITCADPAGLSKQIPAGDHDTRVVGKLADGRTATLRGPVMARSIDADAGTLTISSTHAAIIED